MLERKLEHNEPGCMIGKIIQNGDNSFFAVRNGGGNMKNDDLVCEKCADTMLKILDITLPPKDSYK